MLWFVVAILVDNSNLPRHIEKQCKNVAGNYPLMGRYALRRIPRLGLTNNVSCRLLPSFSRMIVFSHRHLSSDAANQ